MDRTEKDQLITTAEAAEIAAEYGLDDLNAAWWQSQISKRKIPAVVIRRRRRMLRDHVEGYIIEHINRLRARLPKAIRR